MAHVTALGQLRGNSDHANPVRSEHVGIFFDVKHSGEATHKPHLRIFPLQRGEASFKPLFEAARARFTPQLPFLGGDGARWVGDVYFLLDGGMAEHVTPWVKARTRFPNGSLC